MAASGGHALQVQAQRVEGSLGGVKNENLKSICRAHRDAVSGTKSALVSRCTKILNGIVNRGDVVAFEEFKRLAEMRGYSSLLGNNSSSAANAYSSGGSHQYNMAPNRTAGAGAYGNRLPADSRVFKSSPFYEILQTLLPLQDLPEMPQNRHTVKSTLVIKPDVAQQFRSGEAGNLKVLLYCGVTQSMSAYAQSDVAFPNQIEVKVNEQDVKHNFKGLKNKSGSTKPADVTSFLRKFGGQENTIQITYALTTKRFAYAAFLVRSITADKLVERIKKGNIIAKERVLHDMSKANADPDIAATSIRMSLKDPVSTMRIAIPVRSSHCTHNQCFDGVFFLQLQEQAPQWSCPVCSKHVSFESLCVDKYFEDILNRTSRSIEKVELEPNGEWRIIKDEDEEKQKQANGTSSRNARAAYDDDFDDLVEIDTPPSNKPANGVKKDVSYPLTLSPFPGQGSMFGTPPLSSREPSAVPPSVASTSRPSNKRPQSSVIDLTLSDDEDDDPPRPAKRQSTLGASVQRSQSNNQATATTTTSNSYHTPNSIPDSRYPPQQQQLPQRTHSQTFNQNQSDTYRPTSYHTNTNNNYGTNTNSYGSSNYLPTFNSTSNYNNFNTSVSPAQPISPFGQPALPRPPAPASPFGGSNFNIRPPSTSNANGSMHGSNAGLRLPPMQSSPDDQLWNGWRSDFDYGNGGPGADWGSSSPP